MKGRQKGPADEQDSDWINNVWGGLGEGESISPVNYGSGRVREEQRVCVCVYVYICVVV